VKISKELKKLIKITSFIPLFLFVCIFISNDTFSNLRKLISYFGAKPVYADSTTYTTSGTWIAPAGVSSVTVKAWGGGGAGGGGTDNNGQGGGGGGGGEFRQESVAVTSGTVYTVTIGTGGTGSTGDGTSGGASSFNSTSVVANGGIGGQGSANGGAGGVGGSGGTGTTYYLGGSGAAGTTSIGGGGGEGSGSTANGGNASGSTGGSGTDGGDGGDGSTTQLGIAGSAPGGGGGGARRSGGNQSGGAGADGQITLEWSVSFSISGTIYQNNGSSAYDCSANNLTVYLRVNGSGTYSTTCTASGGGWSVSDVSLSSGDTVYAYIYGETEKGSTVLVSNASEQTDVPIIQDRVVLRDDVNGSITNSEISAGNTLDSDDLISFSGSDITVGSSYTTHIYSGDTYAPGANVTTGKLLVVGNYSGSTETLTLTGSGTSTSRPLYINGGTFTSPSSVVFQGTSATTIENASYNNLSFTPTITGATTYTFLSSGSVSGNFTINPTAASSNTLTVNLAGTLTVAPSGTVTITGTTSGLSALNTVSGSNYTISAGKIDIQSAGTLTTNNSNIYLTGTSGTIFTRIGTFNEDTSTVYFQQTSGDTTLTSGTVTFNNLNIDMSGRTGSVGNNVSVGGNLTVTAGTLSIPSTYTLSVTGSTSVTGSLTISSSGNQTFSGTTTINSGGTFTRSSASGTNIFVGKLTISGGGTFTTSNNPAFTLRGGLSNSGTFTSGTGTYTFDTNSQSLEGSAATSFGGNLAISGSITLQNSNTNTVTVTGNLTGTVAGSIYQNNSNATTDFKGAVLATGTLTATANPNTIIYSGDSAQSIKATSYHNLSLTPTITAARTYTFLGAASIAGDLTINPTASSAYTLTVNLGGTLTVANSGTLSITGTSSGSSLLDTVSGSNYGITAGNVSIGSSGTLNARASTLSVRGNWSNSGNFTYNTSTVNFEGTGAQQLSGNTTFYNLSITTSSARAITFQAGNTTSVANNGSLTLSGQLGSLLTLQSSVEDSDWNLQVSTSGTSHSVSYVNVSDSNASDYTEIDASDGTSTNGGGNTNWLWPPPDYKFGFEGLNITGVKIY